MWGGALNSLYAQPSEQCDSLALQPSFSSDSLQQNQRSFSQSCSSQSSIQQHHSLQQHQSNFSQSTSSQRSSSQSDFSPLDTLSSGAVFSNALSIEIYFRVGSSRYEPSFRSNAETVSRFVSRFSSLTDSLGVGGKANGFTSVRPRVVFRATASPEGGATLNKRLSEERFHSARRALIEAGLAPDFFSPGNAVSDMTGIYPEKEFIEVVKTSFLKDDIKEDILTIMNDPANSYEEKIRTLRKEDEGRYWRALSEECLPKMRAFSAKVGIESSVAIMEAATTIQSRDQLSLKEEDRIIERDSIPVLPAPLLHEGILHNRMALKTNALGWGLLVANAGVEFGLSEHISVSVPIYYSGLNYFSERVKFRTLAVQPEVRWNFSRMNGFFVGVHAATAFYNIALGGDYRYQDRSGNTPTIGGGMSVGYRLHFKDNPKWGVEFVIGGGVYRFSYDRFVNEKNGPYVDTLDKTYVGPDNAAISVFYEFDLGRGKKR